MEMLPKGRRRNEASRAVGGSNLETRRRAMKVMVTGGAGFIGSHVADAFVAEGHDVVIVDDLSTGVRENLNSAARFYEVDLRDEQALNEVFAREKPECVSHQAARAQVRESMEKPALYAEVNVIGSLNLLQFHQTVKQAGLRQLFLSLKV